MQIRVSCEELKNIAGKILSVIDRKSTRPILTYALLTAKDGKVQLEVTDLEISTRLLIRAQTTEEGSCCINAKNFYDILKELPNKDIDLIVDPNRNELLVNCENIHYSLLVTKKDDFPTLLFDSDGDKFSINTDDMLNIISKTSHAISNDDTRMFLNGIFLQQLDSKLRAVATDGFRLSLVDLELDESRSIVPLVDGVIIPKKGVYELKKMCESLPGETINLSLNSSFLYISGLEQYFLSIRLISRDYPQYQTVIPTKTSYKFSVERNVFLESIRRISIMSNEKTNGIKIKIGEDKMNITANHQSLGHAVEDLDINYRDKDINVGFNAKYLLETIQTFPDGDIDIELNNELSPIVIKSPNANNYLSIVMPLRL
ncbi:MAG: DNA polymerase III subunit beta [Bdellovibrionales bacterium]|jgi:DNA polymerase III subunit beta|nr:DNA polymerase III subunit beta [Bdellovibrionales bacterium]MBT3525503.1 DNA polymerase III subunit beta [Bdellovibrionales bacterium]MBT7670416.1 DNA polymerase III subunit beta [Bdellovibrionales bacterium]